MFGKICFYFIEEKVGVLRGRVICSGDIVRESVVGIGIGLFFCGFVVLLYVEVGRSS